MIYLYPNSLMANMPHAGMILQPAVRPNPAGLAQGYPWAYDNGAFNGFRNPAKWWATLEAHERYKPTCLFVVCPDVMGNALGTLDKWRTWSFPIVEAGWPIAFVAQDGQELYPFPPEFDWLFIGGTTEWKLGAGADECIRRAKAVRKPVHVGRVNSQKRIRHFQLMEVDTVDGTGPSFEPDNYRRLITNALSQPPLLSLC